MLTPTVYLKDHRRMPLRPARRLPLQDLQAQIPPDWCFRCGSEVFQPGQSLCIHCRGRKGETNHEP